MDENKATAGKAIKLNILRLISLVVIIFALSAATVAWFYSDRQAAVVGKISTPTAIYIGGADKQDVAVINLSGINVEDDENVNRTYDVVFSVHGNHVTQYMLQLAYTTNNQFEYEIYPAVRDPASAPANPVAHVVFASTQDYYVESGVTPLAGHFLNYDAAPEEDLAYSDEDETYRILTYESYPDEYVHKYAYPLYWQTDNRINTTLSGEEREFCDYYVLRVKWNAGAVNTKETDIIYISARTITT